MVDGVCHPVDHVEIFIFWNDWKITIIVWFPPQETDVTTTTSEITATTPTAPAEPSSPNLDSEYDTASDSPSDKEGGGGGGGDVGDIEGEEDGLEDDEDDEEFHDNEDLEEGELIDDDDDSESSSSYDDDGDFEEGSIVLDLERSRGDGQENEDKKKVDTAEDRSNPQYIPKKGTFYEHDDRTTEGPEGVGVKEGDQAEDEVDEEAKTQIKTDSVERPEKVVAKPFKGKTAVADRWSHDRFDESEQAPKSRSELVSAYGYDIRNEDGPPKARRRRRYG